MKLLRPVLSFVGFLAATFVLAQEAPQETVDSGLVEQTERRLMQIDVTVPGAAKVLSTLTADDFTLAVGREDIAEFVVDRVCIDDAVAGFQNLATLGRRRARPDRGTGILTLVCGGKQAGTVTAERRLEGASPVSLEPVDMNFEHDRCGLLVDTIDAGTFTTGRFSYVIGLRRGDETREASLTEFLVVTSEEIAAARLAP